MQFSSHLELHLISEPANGINLHCGGCHIEDQKVEFATEELDLVKCGDSQDFIEWRGSGIRRQQRPCSFNILGKYAYFKNFGDKENR
jgi:hypothetical protein